MKVLTSLKSFVIASIIMLLITVAFAVTEKNEPNDANLPIKEVERFANAIQQIKLYYVKSVSDKELFDNAIQGMISGLDPHSSYLDSQEFENLNATTKGEFSGIGIEVTQEEDALKVITALDESPAAKAGIKPGDLIISVDNTPIKGQTLQENINKLRGSKGSKVLLVILRKGEEKPLQIELTRDIVNVKSVKSKLLDSHLGYIRIANFQSTTGQDVGKAVSDMVQETQGKLDGLILDLRNNPGGLLSAAVEVTDIFLDSNKLKANHLIVYTKGRSKGSSITAKANPGDMLNGVPIVVLINEGSASASEIVAGALKDHKRAVIVGQKSFGKGTVQTIMPLDDKTAIKLTTAMYYTPSGISIQASGIEPDVHIDDIDLTQAKQKPSLLYGISESRLKGHFKNTQVEENVKNQDMQNKNHIENFDKLKKGSTENLILDDFQLYEAYNLLKALVSARNNA